MKTQKYHMVGHHSAIKRCRWLYNSLVYEQSCYKQRFYGINSHQCIQMTPTLFSCNMRCVFCWRAQSGDRNLKWNEESFPRIDTPSEIVEGCIAAQKRLLSGYKPNPKVDSERYADALKPKHVAISLAGEPTIYPLLGDLIQSFHKRGFTTFLVSNGTRPEVLSNLSEEPTQLYISLSAPDKKTFHGICRPRISDAWEKIGNSLALLASFKCPTVIRLTLARHLNLKHPEKYAKLVKKAHPTYIEPKAYMHVGFSRLRLTYQNMPEHIEVQDFAASLVKYTGYNWLDESKQSRVVLLSERQKPIKLGLNQEA
ncbi:MAG: 4-demethylwyosine synthase TYW1 [Candidatus Bathyarchaeota archaeon]|nr:4-demethylwyosine synthase TYW1 [Candidatus Bathyarchaeota archaeon]